MPLALFLFGVLFLVAAVRGKQADLYAVLKDDFTGPNNFFYWAGSLWVIAAVGYIKELRTLSNAFLGLVILVLMLSHRGFFQQFMSQLGSTQAATMPELVSQGKVPSDVTVFDEGGNLINGMVDPSWESMDGNMLINVAPDGWNPISSSLSF